MVEKYSYKNNGNNNISEHFKIKEFASINGTKLYSDDVLIDTNIVALLEQLFNYMNAYKIVITSGYRTSEHEKTVGNKSGKGYHVLGQAADINVWRDASNRYTAKEICLALEDLKHDGGIGYISNTAVHVDTRAKKYYFNELNNCSSIGNSWYDYFGINSNRKKVQEKFNLADDTMNFLDEYKYAKSLYEKLLK